MEPNFVLEDWLPVVSASATSTSSSAAASTAAPGLAANAIVHAWAQIRVFTQQRKTLTSSDLEPFDLLGRHRRSLHLAYSQAKLLQALLSDVNSHDAALLGFVRRFAVLGLLAWIRKSSTVTGKITNSTSMKQPAPETLASIVQSTLRAVEERPVSDHYICEVILLLGTISSLQYAQGTLRSDCLTTIALELAGRADVIVIGAIAEAIAGVGYALAVASQEYFVPIFEALLILWTRNPESPAGAKVSGDRPRVEVGFDNTQTSRKQDGTGLKDEVMLLHLMDFLGSNFLSLENSETANGPSHMKLVQNVIVRVLESNRNLLSVQSTSIMASVGLLRSLYRWGQTTEKRNISSPVHHELFAVLRNLEGIVINICEQGVTPGLKISSTSPPMPQPGVIGAPFFEGGNRQLCRFVSVAVSRCRGLPAHDYIVQCLLFSIFGDALSLDTLYSILGAELATGGVRFGKQHKDGYVAQGEKTVATGDADGLGYSLDDFQVHVDSYFMKNVGAISRAMCDQYRVTGGDLRGQIENLISEYARNLYAKHRQFVGLSLNSQEERWSRHRQSLEKVLESAFMTIAIFFSLALTGEAPDGHDIAKGELAAIALDSLSCVEYFRHVQLREFSNVVQRSITHIAGSETASVLLARLLPAYDDIIKKPGTVSWEKDEVQTTRLLFCFRVMPFCLIKMPEETFAADVAPQMFLYLQHPSENVSKASYALFAAFLSLGVKPEPAAVVKSKKHRSTSQTSETKSAFTLQEHLVIYYIQRSLQGFPGMTPFQGIVAGAGAIARHLPPGSPATLYCLTCLVDKTLTLYSMDWNSRHVGKIESKQLQKSVAGESSDQHRRFPVEEVSAAQKLQILLLHLILLVDLQVLPIFLKSMAKLVPGLPKHFQTIALAEAYDIVGFTDDYSRKPMIVPWLQSLSYLSSRTQSIPNEGHPLKDQDNSDNNPSGTKSINVSNPESVSKITSVDVRTSNNQVKEATEDGNKISNLGTAVEGGKMASGPILGHSNDVSEGHVEDSNEQLGLDDKGLGMRAKL